NTVINYVTTTTEDVTTFINQGEILGESVNLARTYSQTPPNILTPDYFANEIEQHFKDSQVNVTIKNEDEIREEGIG
ncbi:leucyl aminopeptidase family protein, partial [Staphylococcus aureus]|nr:leucyl aminopeptidase family protein [Staphylococcus aureus]